MDELLMERYALAKERVSEIKEEKAVPEPYLDFFQKTAAFLTKNVEVMDGVVLPGAKEKPRKLTGAADLSMDEWKKLNQDLYTAEKIIEMYELVQNGEKDTQIFDRLMAFVGRYYEADRASLFLWDEKMEIWEDAVSYRDQGVMNKARYLEITTQEKLQPWLDFIQKYKVVYIRDRESLKEISEELYTFNITCFATPSTPALQSSSFPLQTDVRSSCRCLLI